MVAVEQVQRRAVFLGEAHAVLVGHHVVPPAVNQRRGAVEHAVPQLRQAIHVERRRHQEHAAGMQERSGRHGNEAAHAGADEHQVALQLLAEVHETRDARARVIDAAIVDGLRLVALAARHFGKRGDLAAPGPTFLAVREHDVSAHGAPGMSARLPQHRIEIGRIPSRHPSIRHFNSLRAQAPALFGMLPGILRKRDALARPPPHDAMADVTASALSSARDPRAAPGRATPRGAQRRHTWPHALAEWCAPCARWPPMTRLHAPLFIERMFPLRRAASPVAIPLQVTLRSDLG